jgi:hypothetical protein
MTYINVTTKMFFDKPGVIAAMSEKSHRCLSSALAFSHTVMKRGMRKRKGISAVGAYPSSHGNPLLKELIYFGLDSNSLGGIVGPTLLGGGGHGTKDQLIEGGKVLPELINEGGTVIYQKRQFRRRDGKNVLVKKPVKQRYRPRPFIELTLPHGAKKLAENMANFELRKGA